MSTSVPSVLKEGKIERERDNYCIALAHIHWYMKVQFTKEKETGIEEEDEVITREKDGSPFMLQSTEG